MDNLTRTENKLKSLAVPSKSIPSEATIKQQAVTRQRKANEAIESLLRQRSLVTCPVVQMQTEPRPHPSVVRSSAVNVAEMKIQQQHEGKDISTDSCASIVLDTFERPGIPLPASEAIAGGTDKIGKLKELLDQINEQRRLLTEEIAREKAEQEATKPMPNEKATKLEIERLERMKRRQEELLEQQQLLQKREREVEELGRQLEEKMAVLQRNHPKQQKEAKKATKPKVHVETKGQKGTIDVDVVQPSSAASSISETSKDSNESVDKPTDRSQPAPVKIIITVNDKGTSPKSKQKKKSKKKLEIPAQQSQATVAPEPVQTTEIIKPLASRKESATGLKKKVIDFSPGSSSTTSTVYRPLPPKIGSLKILQRDVPVTANEPTKPIAPAEGLKYNLQKSDKARKLDLPSSATNLNPNLLKYIVRLLGMSRQSIDQLGVSSTSISTPSASIVNVSSNNAVGDRQPGPLAPNEEESERVNRLRKFIDENYNFLQEIDETLRRSSSDQSTLGSSGERSGLSVDADVSRVEGVWMETLRRRERTMKKQQQQKKVPVESDDRPVSKGKSSKKQCDNPQSVQPIEPSLGAIEPAVQPQRMVQAPAP
uniref:Uncharacterized protein n=1 Tax=Anopheles maculatus TaxID=74869 RepID=A0A182SY90_9DIPT